MGLLLCRVNLFEGMVMKQSIEMLTAHPMETAFLLGGLIYIVTITAFFIGFGRAIREQEKSDQGADVKTKPKESQSQWFILADSLMGKGHKENNIPCQDSNRVEKLNEKWGIAIVADGLSSASNSHMGSKLVVDKMTQYLKEIIEEEQWIKNDRLPSLLEWNEYSILLLRRVYHDLVYFSNEHKYDLHSLATTVIAIVYSPFGLLLTHMGDGRAGYCTLDGEWKSMMNPINGETSSDVMPITAPIWTDEEMLRQYIESTIVDEPVRAFTLMSDGCEDFSFETIVKDENGQGKNVNKPYKAFFEPIIEWISKEWKTSEDQEKIKKEWHAFLDIGNKRIADEKDDKTMIVGYCMKLLEEDDGKEI